VYTTVQTCDHRVQCTQLFKLAITVFSVHNCSNLRSPCSVYAILQTCDHRVQCTQLFKLAITVFSVHNCSNLRSPCSVYTIVQTCDHRVQCTQLFKLATTVFSVHNSRFGSTRVTWGPLPNYAQYGGNYLPTFPDSLPVNGIGSLSQNVCNCHHTLSNNPEYHGFLPKHSFLAFSLFPWTWVKSHSSHFQDTLYIHRDVSCIYLTNYKDPSQASVETVMVFGCTAIVHHLGDHQLVKNSVLWAYYHHPAPVRPW